MLLGALSRGCRRGLLRGLRRDVANGSNRLGHPLASNVVRIDVRCRANNKTTFKQCQNAATKRKPLQHESKNENLQVRAPVCCGEPPLGPTSRHLRPRLYDTRRLDVRCRRVTGHPTSGGGRNVWTTARPPPPPRRHRRSGQVDGALAPGCSPSAVLPQGRGPPPVAFSLPLCLRWSGWDGS